MTDDANDLVELASVSTETEAAIIVSRLESEGVQANAEGALTSSLRMQVPGMVKIVVKPCDLARAKEILIECQNNISEVDWSQVDVGQMEDDDDSSDIDSSDDV